MSLGYLWCKLVNVHAIVNFAQIVNKEGNMLDDYNTVQCRKTLQSVRFLGQIHRSANLFTLLINRLDFGMLNSGNSYVSQSGSVVVFGCSVD